MSQLIDLQNQIVDKIRTLTLIATPPSVTVLPERLGELDNRLARANCALSILVVVTPVQIYRASSDPALRQVTAKAELLILENVAMNRAISGCKTADAAAEALSQGLHGWVIPGGYGTARTMMAECLSLEYGYSTQSLWAIPLSQIHWVNKETQCPLAYRVRLETEFDW